jgi:hypothetical protein
MSKNFVFTLVIVCVFAALMSACGGGSTCADAATCAVEANEKGTAVVDAIDTAVDNANDEFNKNVQPIIDDATKNIAQDAHNGMMDAANQLLGNE